jgi:hypothetical protein
MKTKQQTTTFTLLLATAAAVSNKQPGTIVQVPVGQLEADF